MKLPSFSTLVIICTATHLIRAVYEILKHEKLLKANRTSFVIILINMIVLWFSWFAINSVDPSAVILPAVISYVGIILVITGIILFLTALLTIKSLETYTGDLITTGIYSKIRHPMYLAFLLWLLGGPLYFGGVYSFILAILFAVNILFWRRLEEIELLDRFPGYKDYRKRTWF